MKVGDLVTVQPPPKMTLAESVYRKGKHKPFVSVITAICLPEDQVNGMHLVEVLRQGTKGWYPIGYIRVISESQ